MTRHEHIHFQIWNTPRRKETSARAEIKLTETATAEGWQIADTALAVAAIADPTGPSGRLETSFCGSSVNCNMLPVAGVGSASPMSLNTITETSKTSQISKS